MNAKERKIKILKLIQKLKKASWSEIQRETGIQPKELSYDLKELLRNKKIDAEKDIRDRRKTWYKLENNEKTKAEIKRYEVIEFLESLKEPFSLEFKAEDGPYKILNSWFMEFPDENVVDYVKKFTGKQITKELLDQTKAEMKAKLEKIVGEYFKVILKYMQIKDTLEPVSTRRFVTIQAYEYGEGKKKDE